MPPDAEEGTVPRPEYDPGTVTLTRREQAKAAELTAAGHPVTASAVAKRRRRYQEQGLAGMVDNRARRRMPPHGRTGEAVVAAMRKAIGEAAEDSTRTAAFVFRRTREILAGRRRGRAGGAAVGADPLPPVRPPGSGPSHDRVGKNPPVAGRPPRWAVRAGACGGARRRDADRLHAAGRPGPPGQRGHRPGRPDGNHRRRDQDGDRGGAAADDEVGGRERAAGPDRDPGADAAGLAAGHADVGVGPAVPAAAQHRRAAGARRGPAGDHSRR